MPITNKAEKIVGERNTLAFIKAHVLHEGGTKIFRPKSERTEAGGVRFLQPDALPPQLVRVVPMSGLVWDRSRTTPDEGRVPDVTEILVGMPDLDVRNKDYFATPANPNEEDKGDWYLVVHVSPVVGYRKEARLRLTNSRPNP